MSKAVYSRLWMATSQYHLRRHYGWMHVWKRLSLWFVFYGAFGLWTYFPALPEDKKKLVTFGIWHPPNVGYYRYQSFPKE